MINLNFAICRIPGAYTGKIFKFWAKQISKHKWVEAQISYFGFCLFGLELDTYWWGRDHAGPSILLTFMGLEFSIRIYDSRHWDQEAQCWAR